MAEYSDADYLRWDPFQDVDRDVDIRCRTVGMVTTRKPHKCLGSGGAETMHEILPGTRARVERALIDGKWGHYYICVTCMDQWLIDRHIPPRGGAHG